MTQNEELPFRGETVSVMVRARQNKLEIATFDQRAETHLTRKQDQLILGSLLRYFFSNKQINLVRYLSKFRLLNLASVLVIAMEVKL